MRSRLESALRVGLVAAASLLGAACIQVAGGPATEAFRSLKGITRVSVSSAGGEANGGSWYPLCSPDGRFVVFMSDATDMVPGDTNGETDVFLRDLDTGETVRVAAGPSGEEPNDRVWSPAISADGRLIAFASEASNLLPGDTNECSDVFLRDRLTGRLDKLTVGFSGSEADGRSWVRSFSRDTRSVALASMAANLVPDDTNGCRDVFVFDRTSGEIERVSVSSSGGEGDDESNWPEVSADGRYVVFWSKATNLVPDDSNGCGDVFVRDRRSGRTTRASMSYSGAEANGFSQRACISADGRVVAFESEASNLVPGDTNGCWDVFVRDLETGSTERVSVDSDGGQGSSNSDYPSMSADGRFVAFTSCAGELTGLTENARGACVHDRRTRSTACLGACSFFPQMSPDSRHVLFDSEAEDLVPNDHNNECDVFAAPNPFASAEGPSGDR